MTRASRIAALLRKYAARLEALPYPHPDAAECRELADEVEREQRPALEPEPATEREEPDVDVEAIRALAFDRLRHPAGSAAWTQRTYQLAANGLRCLAELDALRARCLAEEQRRKEAEADRDEARRQDVIRCNDLNEARRVISAERKRREAAELNIARVVKNLGDADLERGGALYVDVIHIEDAIDDEYLAAGGRREGVK